MPHIDSDRLHDLKRWENYLTVRIKPWDIVQEATSALVTRSAGRSSVLVDAFT